MKNVMTKAKDAVRSNDGKLYHSAIDCANHLIAEFVEEHFSSFQEDAQEEIEEILLDNREELVAILGDPLLVEETLRDEADEDSEEAPKKGN